MPNMRGGVTDVEHEIENAREKHAQESALANELLRRQIEFEKNASDKMNGFIDRHGFTWYHVLMILIINNIIVVILGASVSSGIMSASFSPLGVVQADSLYAIQAGEQNVVVESVHGPSAVTVRSAGGGTNDKPMDSRIVLEEGVVQRAAPRRGEAAVVVVGCEDEDLAGGGLLRRLEQQLQRRLKEGVVHVLVELVHRAQRRR